MPRTGAHEYEVPELLKLKVCYGRPYALVRWTGVDAAGDADTWEPLDKLTKCEAAIAAFEQATSRSLPGPALLLPSLRLGAVLVGRTLLYWWPDHGWQRAPSLDGWQRVAFSHVLAYAIQTSALRGTADKLLGAESYGYLPGSGL